jgi:hypothetical protein
MRLVAVLLLGLITAYWAVFTVYLLFLPDSSPFATLGVAMGAGCLIIAGLYGLVLWGTAKRIRWLHIAAIAVNALGALQLFVAQTGDVWALAAVNLAALVLLALTIPRSAPKA